MDHKTIHIPCRNCGTQHKVKVESEGFQRWFFGEELIQDALPTLSAGERELLVSGFCEPCFDKLFSEDVIDDNVAFGAEGNIINS